MHAPRRLWMDVCPLKKERGRWKNFFRFFHRKKEKKMQRKHWKTALKYQFRKKLRRPAICQPPPRQPTCCHTHTHRRKINFPPILWDKTKKKLFGDTEYIPLWLLIRTIRRIEDSRYYSHRSTHIYIHTHHFPPLTPPIQSSISLPVALAISEISQCYVNPPTKYEKYETQCPTEGKNHIKNPSMY